MSQVLDPRQQIEAAKVKQTAAEKAAADMESALRELADKRRELEAAEEQLRADQLRALKEQKDAEIEEKRAHLLLEPDPIDLQTAKQLAKRVLITFEDETTLSEMDPRPDHLTSAKFWESVDEIRSRALTQKVDKDARELILGIEGILQLVDRWEHCRAGHVRVDVGSDGYGLGRDPRDCRAIKRLVKELRNMFDGKAPPKNESIGDLICQNLDFRQIAKMIGMIGPEGGPDLAAIATLVDRGRAAGPSWTCWRWRGCWDLDSAWASRQAQVPILRAKRADEVGGLAMGAHRPGRSDGTGYVRERREELEAEEEAMFEAAQQARAEQAKNPIRPAQRQMA